MKSIYMGLQRALASSTQFLCIMIDTNAKISNFAPVVADDPSSRVSRGEKLFHPWCCIPTIDLELPLPLPAVVASGEDSVQCGGSECFHYNRFDVLEFSRPMFTSAKLFRSVDPDLVSSDILWLQLMDLPTQRKALRQKEGGRSRLAEHDGGSGRTVLSGSGGHKESLVANKMATLQACSVCRRRMAVDYAVRASRTS